MEKDFNKESSDSDYALNLIADDSGENAEDQELSSAEEEMILMAKQQSLIEAMENSKKTLSQIQKALECFKDSSFQSTSQFQTSPLKCPDSLIGENLQAFLKCPNLFSEDLVQNITIPSTLAGSSRQPGSVSDDPIEILERSSRQPDIVSNDPIEALSETPKAISKTAPSFETIIESQIRKFLCNSPPKLSDHEGSGAYGGKGKEAARGAFRYKKGSKDRSSCDSPGNEPSSSVHEVERKEYKKTSKSDVSSSKSLTKYSPVKLSEEASDSPESKPLDLQPSQVKVTGNSSSMKRKGSDSNEKDLDESCTRTLEISKSSGNRVDDEDNLKIAKRQKFEDESSLTSVSDMSPVHQTDQTSNTRDQLILPPTSGLSNVVRCISNFEQSSLAEEREDVPLREREESSLTSVSDMSSDEREESPL